MCNFVVPIRTCSKCRQREPLFHDMSLRDNEKCLIYMDTAQDCYSRWCVFSSEHPKTCNYCWLTCKHGHGKTRKIHGGSPSYVCHGCAPRARRHGQPAWKPPRPAHPIDSGRDVVCAATRGFWSVTRFLSR
ncbi:hypothetical protein HD554DRAFT_785418 [Boletus coccyginus]|nr:hypothetical protein HD554DRAFT_785418 [Boletus coccyginus]